MSDTFISTSILIWVCLKVWDVTFLFIPNSSAASDNNLFTLWEYNGLPTETNWIEWSTNYIKEDKLIYEHLRKLEDTHGNYIEIPISDIVAKNREFFDERLKELKKGIYNINNVYNFMNYRNTHDLKNEYIGLYED